LGTILLSVLAGHKRYAHVTTIRSDGVLPGLLGMKRVRSEDAVRRAFLKGEAAEYAQWLRTHLEHSYEELSKEPWILDMDGTVKPSYGEREQAVRGYNPTKHDRPSHVYQTCFIGPSGWCWMRRCKRAIRPLLFTRSPGCGPGWIGGPVNSGRTWCGATSAGARKAMMVECEKRGLRYLFKTRQNHTSATTLSPGCSAATIACQPEADGKGCRANCN